MGFWSRTPLIHHCSKPYWCSILLCVLWVIWLRCMTTHITWFSSGPSMSWPSLYVLCNLLSILRLKRTLMCITQYSHSVVVYTLGLSHTVYYCVEIIAGKGENMQVLTQTIYHLVGVLPKLVSRLNGLCRMLSLQCCIFYCWPFLLLSMCLCLCTSLVSHIFLMTSCI